PRLIASFIARPVIDARQGLDRRAGDAKAVVPAELVRLAPRALDHRGEPRLPALEAHGSGPIPAAAVTTRITTRITTRVTTGVTTGVTISASAIAARAIRTAIGADVTPETIITRDASSNATTSTVPASIATD